MTPSTKEKARVGVPTPATGHNQNSQLNNIEIGNNSQRKSGIDPARLRHLARRISGLGERALYELFRELLAGADLAFRLEVYARLDPSVLAALGGVTLPVMMTAIDGGRAC
jgi:hypothetical protein